jgi:hypothetical protein
MAGKDDKLVVRGSYGQIWYASRPNGSRLAEEFYVALPQCDKAKVDNLFKWLADAGYIRNRTKFKPVEDDLLEFKASAIRISCYQDQRRWYLLHGFFKKGPYWPQGELIRAKHLLEEHRGF